MSDIPRYKPVANDRLGIADDADGKLCEYRYYEQLKSTIQSFAQNVLRLGNEVRDLAKERDALKEHIRYLEIELTTETARWEMAMQENERLRAEVLTESQRWKQISDRWIPCNNMLEENARLKAEVERLYRQGDLMLKFAARNMTYPAYVTMAKDWEEVKALRAAKDGNPSE